MMNLSRAKGSLIPSEIQITSLELLSKTGKNSTESTLHKAESNRGTIYVAEFAWWGGDDADVYYHAFQTLKAAENCLNEYNLPISKQMELHTTETFVVLVGDKKKFVPGVLFKGYLVNSLYGGDVLVPYFNSEVLHELGLVDKVRALGNEAEIGSFIGSDVEPALLRLGENPHGRKVLTYDQYQLFIFNNTKIVEFITHKCWETGLIYHQLSGHYPTELFAKMKPFLSYHSEELEEEGDWKGWYISEKGLEETLKSLGFEIKINY